MILEFFEIADDLADEIVVKSLKETMKRHKKERDPDSPEIVAACKKLLECYEVQK